MAIFGNKGEWSEIYVLFKLLGDTKVFTGDENLNKIESIFYPILKILREERGKSYEYDIENRDVVFITEDGKEFMRMPVAEFRRQADRLFRQIKAHKGVFFGSRYRGVHGYRQMSQTESAIGRQDGYQDNNTRPRNGNVSETRIQYQIQIGMSVHID